MIANGRARVNPRNPDAFGICDRCGFRYNRKDLTWQMQWAGETLENLRILVCRSDCLDEPNPQLRAYIPPPDPLPIIFPRPDNSNMNGGAGFFLNGIFLCVNSVFGWPLSSALVPPGGAFLNGIFVAIRPGGPAFNPALPGIYYNTVSTYAFLSNYGTQQSQFLPLSDAGIPQFRLFDSGGFVCATPGP